MKYVWLLLALNSNPNMNMPMVAFKEQATCERAAARLKAAPGWHASCEKVDLL